MQFLRGLNYQYNNIKVHVLLTEPVLIITKKISLVVQQERQLNNSFLIANIKNSNPTTHTNFVTCSFYGKLGHN